MSYARLALTLLLGSVRRLCEVRVVVIRKTGRVGKSELRTEPFLRRGGHQPRYSGVDRPAPPSSGSGVRRYQIEHVGERHRGVAVKPGTIILLEPNERLMGSFIVRHLDELPM